MAKTDIRDRKDLEVLMNAFYSKLLQDTTINYIFIDVAKIDIKEHIPVIVDFWETILFQTGTYQKNAIQPHLDLNQKTRFKAAHFKTWLSHFEETVDQLFEGETATRAKQRANSIATIMQIKLKTGQ